MWIRRAVVGVAAASLVGVGLVALPSPAQAVPDPADLYWIADVGAGNRVWNALSSASPFTPAAVTPAASASYTYRSLASDGTHLFFVDDANSKLVRTDLNGSNREVIAAVSASAEAIVYSGGYVYWTQYTSGVYRASATASGATPTRVVIPGTNGAPNAFGYAGITVTGTDLYFSLFNGTGSDTVNALYYASLATVPVSSVTKGSTVDYFDFGPTNLATDGTSLYMAGNGDLDLGRAGVLKATLANWNSSLSSGTWALLDTATQTSSTKGISVYSGTLYFTNSTNDVFSMSTTGASLTSIYDGGVGPTSYAIAAVAPHYTVTYDGNLNTGGAVPVDSLSPYTSGSTVTVLGNTGSLIKTDYQFARWDTTANNTGTSRQPGATFTIGGNTVLYALWVGGPFEFRTDPSGPAIATAAFPSGSNGQQKDLTLYVRNVGAAATIGVPASAVGAPLGTSTCPRVGGTIQQYNPAATPPVTDCTFNLTWTVSGNLSGVFSFANGMPTSSSVALTGVALSVARTPTFSSPVSTADGFTVNVTNWDSNWTWTPTVGSGTVTAGTGSGSTLPLTVTGLAASASATVAVTTTRSNYFDGSATVVGTASAASGGGGGGGGTSTPSTDTPTTTTTTPTTPTTVTPAAPSPLGPEEGLPVTTLTPGGTTVTTGGQPTPVTTVPNKTRGTVTSGGDDWSLTTGGRTPAGKSQPTSPTGVVQVPQGGSVVVSGKGYEPGTSVQVYAMNPALLLGTFTVGADGKFRDSVTWPAGLGTGAGVLQVNGFSTSGAVRSYSLGLGVIKDASGRVRTVERTVYFAAGSSWLSPTAKATLAKTVASVPKGASLVSVVATGYVQGTSDTSNDFTLSTARATKAAAQMKADKLVGKCYVTGRGVAKESGALGRKVIVMVTYR